MPQTLILPNANGYAWVPSKDMILCFMPSRKVTLQYLPKLSISAFMAQNCEKCVLFKHYSCSTNIPPDELCPGISEITLQDKKCPENKHLANIKHVNDVVLPHVFAYDALTKEHFLFIASTNNTLKLTPYRYGNVHPEGRICWGATHLSPHSLKEQYNTYWETLFNKDLVPSHYHFEEWIQQHCIEHSSSFSVPTPSLIPGGEGTYFCHIAKSTCTFGKHHNGTNYLWQNDTFQPIPQPKP